MFISRILQFHHLDSRINGESRVCEVIVVVVGVDLEWHPRFREGLGICHF